MPDRIRKANQRMQMQAALGSVPAPMNEVEISMPDLMEEEADTQAPLEEDAADADKRRAKEEQKRLEIERQKQSQPVKLGLPRPVQTGMMIFESAASQAGEVLEGPKHLLQQAETLLHEEMGAMVTRDAFLFPVKGAKPPKKAPPAGIDFSLEELKGASELLEDELEAFAQDAGGGHNSEVAVQAAFDESTSSEPYVFLPSAKRYVDGRLLGKKERVESARHKFEIVDSHHQKEVKKSKKLEEKMERLLGGYMTKARQALLHIRKLSEERETISIETEVFQTLRAREEKAIQSRVEELRDQVEHEKQRNLKLQNRYKALRMLQKQIDDKLQ